jgi:hypothetical protein
MGTDQRSFLPGLGASVVGSVTSAMSAVFPGWMALAMVARTLSERDDNFQTVSPLSPRLGE